MPKIADFGLSRIFGDQQSRIITKNSVGSRWTTHLASAFLYLFLGYLASLCSANFVLHCRGYMAPEYLLQGIISTKADIYSLGVIMIKLITGSSEYPYLQLDSPQSTATSCQRFTEDVRWINTAFASIPSQ
jgi:interleukin-1 receptor-associated kinase 1